MGLQLTRSQLTLGDVPTDATTWIFGGTDRLDVSVAGADARLELRPPGGPWLPPQRVPRDIARSIAGLALAYPNRGIEGFRLSNWTAGQIAVVDVEAYSVG